MLKKRIIFTLLYDNGKFMLSRNFRLQQVGNLGWLQRNYNFADVAFYIDELIVLDVTRGQRNTASFCEALKQLTTGCFVPVAAGGGINNMEEAKALLRAGADKVVLNTVLVDNPGLVKKISSEFGQQCVVGAVDVKSNSDGGHDAYTHNGEHKVQIQISDLFSDYLNDDIGELYLNSIDRDGTGQGYDFSVLKHLPSDFSLPVIMAGGVGNAKHLAEGLANPKIDAVATAHLFNFVGDGLKAARNTLLEQGVELAFWKDISEIEFNQYEGDLQ